jgi:hypothetical protein
VNAAGTALPGASSAGQHRWGEVRQPAEVVLRGWVPSVTVSV